ncbi:MAG: ABC transporter permease [Rhodobacteraceae bacterium]|nr:MAG: ABC transporter permease [Paracoccaceae bacterium]
MSGANAPVASVWWRSDLARSLATSPVALISALLACGLTIAALGADVLAPVNVFDPRQANIADARLPPGATGLFGDSYPLGTDPQGRDMLSAMLYGLRTSLLVGLSAVFVAAAIGVALGLICGYFGGLLDAVVMRVADVFLSFPPILIALLIDGVARTVLDRADHARIALPVVVIAIAASYWVQYARTVRTLTMIERKKDYVLAARVTGVGAGRILFTHILPNTLSPVLVIATVNLALAILTEATLSFLGVGIPPTQPSLGSLIRIGNEFLFSGDWWIAIFPGALLFVYALTVNLFGDWLRQALNPRLDR